MSYRLKTTMGKIRIISPKKAENILLDYFNNYYAIDVMAEHYEVTERSLHLLIKKIIKKINKGA